MLRACLLSLLTFVVFDELAPSPAAAQQSGPGTPGVASLQQTLESGLKARTPDEFAFIALVVGKVNTGELPRSLVDTTFDWARRKPHPMQFFEFGLRERAKKAGISL